MIQLPQKSHFKMDEVCGLTGVKPYVLRFWESEFPEIKPSLSSSGQKLFSYRDVEVIYHIKQLLFEQKCNIEQAKLKLSQVDINIEESAPSTFEPQVTVSPVLDEKNEVRVIRGQELTVDKLLLAKEKLHMVLSLTQDIQARNDWA